MPIKHGALRQIQKARRRALRNKDVQSELKTLKKRVVALMAQGKSAEASALLPLVVRKFDQAATKGILHHNTASRIKSRLMRQLAKGRPAGQTGPAPAA